MSHFMVHGVNIMVNWNGMNIVMNFSVMWG